MFFVLQGFEGSAEIISGLPAFEPVKTSTSGWWNIRVMNSSLISVGTFNIQVRSQKNFKSRQNLMELMNF